MDTKTKQKAFVPTIHGALLRPGSSEGLYSWSVFCVLVTPIKMGEGRPLYLSERALQRKEASLSQLSQVTPRKAPVGIIVYEVVAGRHQGHINQTVFFKINTLLIPYFCLCSSVFLKKGFKPLFRAFSPNDEHSKPTECRTH